MSSKVESPTATKSDLPPEGGARGWICVVGAFVCLFCTFGFLNAIGVFQTYYEQHSLSHYSSSEISWIFAVQLCLMWALGPLYGRLLDTFGPGPVLYPCSVLCVFALCMTSLADEYYQIFLAQGLGFGIGAGGVFTSAMVCVGQWFVKRRGLALGIAACGSSTGGVIFPIFLNRVVQAKGFYGAVRYTALFIGVLLAGSCFMVRSRLPRKAWDFNAPWFDLSLFKEKQFALYSLGAFFVMWGLWGPFDYLPSMAQEEAGFSSDLALYLISLINATSIPGRVIPPHIADHIGHFNVITTCALTTGVSMLCLWLPFHYHPSHAGLIVFALVYGFVTGAVVSLLMPCVAKSGKLETLGVRFGTFQMVVALGCLTGLPIMGAILKTQNASDFAGLEIFASVSALLGASLLAMSTYFMSLSRGTWRV
ncbi:hypothetical protein N7492_003946 [Penicillium capsulatum]|uniref:Major facilitator superfamily (MFS) profile domain-containing protein n=1 Tax=Penicillium capsulatum TaxID=69766 RepID=A0A9W9IS29_9EURO|nr:hypothetical protein N7492_003946 [Penicillium capsulatum]KAJ6121476.1 hypothetical protein N7512_003941 [Penicillium capsulatum]